MKDLWKTLDKSTGKQGRQGQVLWDSPKAQTEEGLFTTDGTRENTHTAFIFKKSQFFPLKSKQGELAMFPNTNKGISAKCVGGWTEHLA